MQRLRDYWNDDYYNEVIKSCAKTCKSCAVLQTYIGKPYDILDSVSKQHFKEIVVNTYERLDFGV